MMGRIKRLFQIFADLGIRDKLLLSFALLISVPVLFIAFRSLSISSAIIEQKTNQYSHDILQQVSKTMETRLEKIEDISFNVTMNKEVQEMLFAVKSGALDAYEASRISTRIESILSAHVLYHDEINAIYVVSDGGFVYELDKTKQKYSLLEEYVEDIRGALGSTVWYGGLEDHRVVALTCCINSTQTQKPIAYLIMYVEENFLFELLSQTESFTYGSVFIIDGNGMIVSAVDKELIGTKCTVTQPDALSEAYSFTTQLVDEIPQYITQSERMENGWRIVTTVPVSVYQSEINALKNSIIFMAVVILLLSVVCAWKISINISRPIRHLSSTMVRFGEGDLSVRCPEGSKDETGQLSATFNNMADNINDLLQKVYDEQLMKRDAQLRSLQMQINPHFLYNTLETINWMARMHGTEDIGIMAKSLGDLMRATINGKDYVLLKDEILSLNNYLKIQKYRYGDKFEAVMNILPETGKLYVPKLIIQPLVENAIYHGVDPSFENGTIHIRSWLKNDELFIEVQDDGVGMSQETIDNILKISDKVVTTPHSIGLQNVIKRIKTLFGDSSGITIESDIGEGTRILVRLPVLTEIPKSYQDGRGFDEKADL